MKILSEDSNISTATSKVNYNVLVGLLFLFVFAPNLQIINESFILSDWLSIVILALLICRSPIYAVYGLWAGFFVILLVVYLFLSSSTNAWLVIARFGIYISIPLLVRINCSASVSARFLNIIRRLSFLLLILWFSLDLFQRMQIINNDLQVDYYMRALGTLIDDDGHRYAWFDEHFVATPALMVLAIIILRKFSFLLIGSFAIVNGSRMIAIGLFAAIIYNIKSFPLKVFLGVAAVVAFILFVQSDYFDQFYDLQLRIGNWSEHLKAFGSPSEFILGYDRNEKGLSNIPIDNFFVRFIVNLGLVGFALAITLLLFMFHNSTHVEKLFFLTFTFAAFLNDLFAYPPTLAVFCGGLALFRIFKI